MPHTYRDSLDQLRFERGIEHIHKLGVRTTAAAIAEIADRIGGWPTILAALTAYERISPGQIRAAGADRLPPRPLRVVA